MLLTLQNWELKRIGVYQVLPFWAILFPPDCLSPTHPNIIEKDRCAEWKSGMGSALYIVFYFCRPWNPQGVYQSDDDIVSSWESIKEGDDTWKNLKPFTNLTRMLLCILHHFGLQLWKLGGCCLPYTTHTQYKNISFWCSDPVYCSFIDCKTLSWHMQDGKIIIAFSVAGWDRWPLEECHSTRACWELSKDQCFHDAASHHPRPIHWSCPCLMHQTYKHNQ